MARAERLMDLAERLRASDATTVATLAGELGVSRRTLLRDLAALRARGLPITGEPGPGGGLRLERDRGVTAVHLSLAEGASMWLAATLARETSDLPWGDAARSALAKLLASLPRDRARELRALCRRVVVGPSATARVREGAGRAPAELLGVFERAFTAGQALAFHYVDREGRPSARRVEPHGLLVEPPVWYVLAWDLDRGAPRMFRMDRISRPRPSAGAPFRPDLTVVQRALPETGRYRALAGD